MAEENPPQALNQRLNQNLEEIAVNEANLYMPNSCPSLQEQPSKSNSSDLELKHKQQVKGQVKKAESLDQEKLDRMAAHLIQRWSQTGQNEKLKTTLETLFQQKGLFGIKFDDLLNIVQNQEYQEIYFILVNTIMLEQANRSNTQEVINLLYLNDSLLKSQSELSKQNKKKQKEEIKTQLSIQGENIKYCCNGCNKMKQDVNDFCDLIEKTIKVGKKIFEK